MRHLCDACARQLVPHWDLVAALYDGVQAAGGAAPPAANGAAASPLLEEDVHNVRFACRIKAMSHCTHPQSLRSSTCFNTCHPCHCTFQCTIASGVCTHNLILCGQVMEGAALVSNVLPADQRPAALQRLFSPVVQPLHQMLAAQPQPQSVEQREAILTLADRLGVLFRCSSLRLHTATCVRQSCCAVRLCSAADT